jgi:hypothetical protein
VRIISSIWFCKELRIVDAIQRLLMPILFCVLLLSHFTYASTRYVKPTSTGSGDGSSWVNASGNLQAMIDSSLSYDEVWVMAGTYIPANYPTGCTDCNEDRDFSFILKNQVKVYGGFIGTESLLSERTNAVISANPSVLSGDIGVIDDMNDNVYHVIMSVSDDSTTVLDGFTIFKGFSLRASGNRTIKTKQISIALGAGMHTRNSFVKIRNSSFEDNKGNSGGGMYNNYSDISIENCVFSNNFTDNVGGGVRNNSGSIVIYNSTFTDNDAFRGGGLYSDSGTELSVFNSTFTNNYAYYGGGAEHFSTVSSIFKNCTFTGNTANTGAGIHIYWAENITLFECKFISNNATYGGAVSNWQASPKILHCTFKGNIATETGGAMETRFQWYEDLYVANCIFIENSAKFGGAVHNYLDTEIHFVNCTFTSNEASENGGAMYNTSNFFIPNGGSGSPVRAYLRNCIFWNNKLNGSAITPGADIEGNHDNFYQFYSSYTVLQLADNTTNYWVATSQGFIRNGYSDGGVANLHATDPLFVNGADLDGADNIFGTSDDGIALQNCSPVINKGNNNENTDTTDFLHNIRIKNLTVDIGAYENGAVKVSIAANPNTPFCSGTSNTFTASPINGGTAPTYDFKINGISQQNSTSSTFVTSSLINNDLVTVSMISNLCSFDIPAITDTLSMTVYDLPVPITQNNSPLCAGENVNFTGSGGLTYSWSGPNDYTSSAQNPSISNASTSLNGIYSFIVTNVNNCTASATTTLTVNALPIATAGSNSPQCTGNTLNLNSSGGSSYTWSGPNSFSSNTQNPEILGVNNSLAGIFTVTVGNANSCTATASTVVTINAIPSPIAGSNSPICAGDVLNLNSAGGNAYSWQGPATFTSSEANPSRLNAQFTWNGTYTVTVTSIDGCTATADVSVQVNQEAPAISVNPSTINFGESTILAATGCSAGTIKWNMANLTGNPLTVNLDNTSSFKAICTVGACISSFSNEVFVTVNGNPCQNQVTLISSANDLSSGIYKKMASNVSGKITATNKISGTSKVIYQGKSIELNAGFKADNGTLFLAEIGGCN